MVSLYDGERDLNFTDWYWSAKLTSRHLFQTRNEALKDVNLGQEDDIKALRMKTQQLEDEYQAVKSELDETK